MDASEGALLSLIDVTTESIRRSLTIEDLVMRALNVLHDPNAVQHLLRQVLAENVDHRGFAGFERDDALHTLNQVKAPRLLTE